MRLSIILDVCMYFYWIVFSIAEECAAYGIVKIIPPEGWNPPFCIDENSDIKFHTRLNNIHTLQVFFLYF